MTGGDLVERMLRAVVFVYYHDKDRAKQLKPLGTGMVLGVQVPASPRKYGLLILTARHVVSDRDSFAIRFPGAYGDRSLVVDYVLQDLRDSTRYWEHRERSADICLIRTKMPRSSNLVPFPLSNVASKEDFFEWQIRPTDRVIFPTLLRQVSADTEHFPVVRDGMVSLVTTEARVDQGSPGLASQELVLIDGQSVPGASGAPVFLSPSPRRLRDRVTLTPPPPLMIGVIRGFLRSPPQAVEAGGTGAPEGSADEGWTDLPDHAAYRENAGVATVTPSWRILEVLDQAGASFLVS